jgi:predicted permease
MFLDKAVWKTTLIRMLLIPAITVAVLLPIPLDAATKTVLMVAIAAPTGIVTAMFAQMYDTDYLFATRVVGLTTLLSLGLLPGWIAVLSAALRWIG